MNNRQSFWILSALMTLILCGIGVLSMLDFDNTIGRIVNEEVSMKTSDSRDANAAADRDTQGAMPSPEVHSNPKRSNEIEISPAVMEEKAEEKSSPQETINGLKQQTTILIPQVALVNTENTLSSY